MEKFEEKILKSNTTNITPFNDNTLNFKNKQLTMNKSVPNKKLIKNIKNQPKITDFFKKK